MKKIYGILSIIVVVAVCVWVFAPSKSPMHSDEYYMGLAIAQAKHNLKGPFGAVIVDNKTGEVLGEGFYRPAENPTYHGELVAINDCIKKHPHVDWKETTLYTTAEPCPMCQSAIIWTGIQRVVYATSMEYLKPFGDTIYIRATEVNSKAPFYKGTITAGVLANQTDPMFSKARTL